MVNEPDAPPDVLPMEEDDPMPFGKHRGRPLCTVPASYLLWFFEQPWAAKDWPALYDYVEDNYDDLRSDSELEDCCIDYEDTF